MSDIAQLMRDMARETRKVLPKLFDRAEHTALSAMVIVLDNGAAEVERLRERLEMDFAWQFIDGVKTKVKVEPGSIPDGIDCRNETIRLQDERYERMRDELQKLRAALAVPEQEGASEVKGLASSRANTPLPAPDAGWRDMESAPKGGGAELVTDPNYVNPPKILLRFGTEAVSVAYWDWYYAEGGSGYRDGFAWIEPCSGEPLNLHYTTPPDGWRPLPAPPVGDVSAPAEDSGPV